MIMLVFKIIIISILIIVGILCIIAGFDEHFSYMQLNRAKTNFYYYLNDLLFDILIERNVYDLDVERMANQDNDDEE